MANNFSSFDNDPYRIARFTTYGSNGGVNVVKTGAGFLYSITLGQLDAAPTAGDITIYDSVATYGHIDNIILKHSQTTGVFMPTTVEINAPFVNGLSIGFTAPIKDVNVLVKYK